MDFNKIKYIPVQDIETLEIIGKRPVRSITLCENMNGWIINGTYLASRSYMERLIEVSEDDTIPVME